MRRFVDAMMVFVTIGLVFLAAFLANLATSYFFSSYSAPQPLRDGPPPLAPPEGADVEWAWSRVGWASDTYYYVFNRSFAWIFSYSVDAAILGMSFPNLADYLRSITFWESWAMTITAYTALALSWFCRALLFLQPWLLSFGAALAVSGPMKRLGGALLAIYLVMGAAMVYGAAIVYSSIAGTEFPDISPVEEQSSAWNLVSKPFQDALKVLQNDFTPRYERAAKAAVWATVVMTLTVAISSLLTNSASSVLGGLSAADRVSLSRT